MQVTTAESPSHSSDPPPAPTLLGHEMEYTAVDETREKARAWRLFWQFGRIQEGAILTVRIGGDIPDAEPQLNLLDIFFASGDVNNTISLEAFCEGVRLAAHDPRIAGILLVVDPLACGWARVSEMRRHLQYFSSAGKTITVFMEQGGPKEFFLGMGFELYMPPLGLLSLWGFSASAEFVRGLLDKLGIEPQVERIGAYKSAGDQLTHTEMSKEQREMLDSILKDIDTTWVKSLCEVCGKTEEEVRQIIKNPPLEMNAYKDAGLVTGLKYLSEVLDELIMKQFYKHQVNQKQNNKWALNSVSLRSYRRGTNEWTLGIEGRSDKTIALIRANGAITSGKSGYSSVMGGETIGSDSIVPLLRKAAHDDSIVAVVLRCDSPGGSALASDIVYEEIRRLKVKKPVIASMGDVAASGGYYISMAATEIVAENLSLTGSVGVVGMKPSLKNLYEKLGYAKETISIGRYAQLETEEREFTEDEASYWKKSIEHMYKSFVTKAADARGKTFDEMDQVAQGRVWTGKQALERGLIDHIGGLRKAIEVAKSHADIFSDDEFVSIRTIAEPQGLEKLFSNPENEDIFAQAPFANRSFGISTPLAIADVGPLLSGPSPLNSFLLGSIAAATLDVSTKFRSLLINRGPVTRILGSVLRNLLLNSMNR